MLQSIKGRAINLYPVEGLKAVYGSGVVEQLASYTEPNKRVVRMGKTKIECLTAKGICKLLLEDPRSSGYDLRVVAGANGLVSGHDSLADELYYRFGREGVTDCSSFYYIAEHNIIIHESGADMDFSGEYKYVQYEIGCTIAGVMYRVQMAAAT